MPPSRKSLSRAFSLLFILPYPFVAAYPSKSYLLSPVIAGRSVDTAASTFDPQIYQDDSITGSTMVALFPTGETTSEEKFDILPGYGDDNSQAGLISADPSEISRCGQNPEGMSQIPSGKGRFKRQTNDKCPPDAYLAKPGVVQQKVPVKDQTPGEIQDDEKLQNPGLNWEPFFRVQKPPTGRTNEGKCRNIEHPVAVCFAPLRSSIVPAMSLLGGLMGMLDPVSLDNGYGCAAAEEKYCCSYVLPIGCQSFRYHHLGSRPKSGQIWIGGVDILVSSKYKNDIGP